MARMVRVWLRRSEGQLSAAYYPADTWDWLDGRLRLHAVTAENEEGPSATMNQRAGLTLLAEVREPHIALVEYVNVDDPKDTDEYTTQPPSTEPGSPLVT